MCGVAGIIGLSPFLAKGVAPAMLEALGHRGPDGRGYEHLPAEAGVCTTLLHTRLAVLDLSEAGRQPMAETVRENAHQGCWIVYNGELFNFAELRRQLVGLGAEFRTGTDTEVILKAYRFWGQSAVEKFEGMFAFCLLDPDRRTAWLCRDRLGIKPLYFCHTTSGGMLFASEVRAILAAGDQLVPRRLRRAAVESFLAQ